MSETNVVNEFSGNSEFLINELIEEQKKLQKTVIGNYNYRVFGNQEYTIIGNKST